MKKLIIVVVIVVLAIFTLRLLSPEDTWFCQNGQWVKHGNPSSPQPTTGCR